MAPDDAHWQRRLEELVDKHQVPGASLAIHADGRTVQAAAGVLNLETGVEVTTDSVFQIGSSTKAYTATMAMRLVERGTLELDSPIKKYLPEFRVADEGATQGVTLRHLLVHTSGIDGDHFADMGRGDDCLERYLASCATVEQALPLDTTFSYCNTGYAIIGRLIEQVTGKTWDAALRGLLVEPLGLMRTVTLPEEALRFRVAHGHVPAPGGATTLAPYWGTPRSMGPAGGIVATASDLLDFARLHLAGGVAPNGTRVLAADTVAAMRTPQVDVADHSIAHQWGLGLMLQDWGGVAVIGHDGGTVGQSAILRWVPERDFAVAIQANGGGTSELHHALLAELAHEYCGVALPAPIEPTGAPLPADIDDWLGVYDRVGLRLTVARADDGLVVRAETGGLLADAFGAATFEAPLEPVHDHVFAAHLRGDDEWIVFTFFTLPGGGRFIHMGARAHRRIAAQA